MPHISSLPKMKSLRQYYITFSCSHLYIELASKLTLLQIPGLENLPTELQRNFHLMRDLDQRSQDVMRNIDQVRREMGSFTVSYSCLCNPASCVTANCKL